MMYSDSGAAWAAMFLIVNYGAIGKAEVAANGIIICLSKNTDIGNRSNTG